MELIERYDAEGLETARALDSLDDDSRPLIGDLVAAASETGHMEENVGHAVIGQDEAEAFGHIEPLDPAAHLDEIERRIRSGVLRDLAAAEILRSFLAEIE